MTIAQYWKGQIPGEHITIDVRGSDGRVISLGGYTDFNVKMIGSDNEEVDLTGSTLSTSQIGSGRFVFYWPKGRSVFNKPGAYILQLELNGDGIKDYTSVLHIKVKELGGTN